MEYAPEPPEEIAEYIKRAHERDRSTNVYLLAQHIVNEGFLLIGTADPEPKTEYHPQERQLFLDNIWRSTVLIDKERATLQATWSGKLAIQCALFGDVNTPGQRMATDPDIFTQRYQYGWSNAPNTREDMWYDDDIVLNADERLLPLLRRHRQLNGRIDIIRHIPNTFEYTTVVADDGEHYLRTGMLKTYEPQQVVGSLPVVASDIYRIEIEWWPPSWYAPYDSTL